MIRKTLATKTKSFDVDLKNAVITKSASGDCIIEGYANTSSKDRVGDVVMPTAFAKTLKTYMSNPVLLANHDWNDPCGVVLEAEITDKGLWIKARISNSREDIKTLINEGCLRTFSIGYNEVDTDYDESTKTKYIKELELLEISVVTVPANTEAMFTASAAKSEPKDESKSIEAGVTKEAAKAEGAPSPAAPAEAPAAEAPAEGAMSEEEIAALEAEADKLEQDAINHVLEYVSALEDSCAALQHDDAKGGPGSGRRGGGGSASRTGDRQARLSASRERLAASAQHGNAVRQGLQRARAIRNQAEQARATSAARRGGKNAASLADLIITVKSVVGRDLNVGEITAVCSYFINQKEDPMTKEQLIAALRGKSAKDASVIPASASVEAKADEAAPAEAASGQDPIQEIMAKLDAIGQAMAQILEGMKPAEPKAEEKPADEAAPAEEGKADDKPADEEEEMSDEECEKALADIAAEIAALEDSDEA